jgi:hypothetical protein
MIASPTHSGHDRSPAMLLNPSSDKPHAGETVACDNCNIRLFLLQKRFSGLNYLGLRQLFQRLFK